MVFGTFDGVHEGHRNFLRQAKSRGDYLIAVVAQDASAQALKNRAVRSPLQERMRELTQEHIADKIVAGDTVAGSWAIIHAHKPDVVATGYDQQELYSALTNSRGQFLFVEEIIMMEPFHPEQYHSSLLGKAR